MFGCLKPKPDEPSSQMPNSRVKGYEIILQSLRHLSTADCSRRYVRTRVGRLR